MGLKNKLRINRLAQSTKKMNSVVEKRQRALANWLDAKFSQLSKRQQIACVITFFTVMFSASVFVAKWSSPITVDTQKVVQLRLIPDDKEALFHSQNMLMDLEHYLDSLDTTVEGRTRRSRIMEANPGLLDSMAIWRKQLEQSINH